MALISLNKIKDVLPEFIDTRLMPSAPTTMKWILGGSTYLILQQSDALINKYSPMLKSLGIVNDQNQVNIEIAKGFLDSAFNKSPTLEMYGIKFDKGDGNALIDLLLKYKDE